MQRAKRSPIIMQIENINPKKLKIKLKKIFDVRPYDWPYKVLLLACAANFTMGTIVAITLWKGEGEGNAQA